MQDGSKKIIQVGSVLDRLFLQLQDIHHIDNNVALNFQDSQKRWLLSQGLKCRRNDSPSLKQFYLHQLYNLPLLQHERPNFSGFSLIYLASFNIFYVFFVPKCLVSYPLCLKKDLGQVRHLNGLSPEWIRRWSLILLILSKGDRHIKQTYLVF